MQINRSEAQHSLSSEAATQCHSNKFSRRVTKRLQLTLGDEPKEGSARVDREAERCSETTIEGDARYHVRVIVVARLQ